MSDSDVDRVVVANPLFQAPKRRSSSEIIMRVPTPKVGSSAMKYQLATAVSEIGITSSSQKSKNNAQPTLLYPHSLIEASWFKSTNWSVPDPNYKPIHYDSPNLVADWADPPAPV